MIKAYQSVFNNISWLLIYRVIRLILAFFISAWVARYLGPDKYGLLSYSIAIAEIVMLFWSQGLKEVVIRAIKDQILDGPNVSIASFQLMLIGNTILLGVLFLLTQLLDVEKVSYWMILIAGLGIWFRSFEGLELWFHANLVVRFTIRVQLFSQVIYMIINAFLILERKEVLWFVYSYSFQLVVTGIGFFLVFKKHVRESICFLRGQWESILSILKMGYFFIIARVIYLIGFHIDKILIESFIGLEELGLYVVSLKVITIWTFISASISLSFLPILNRHGEEFEMKQSLNLFYRLTLISSLFLTGMVYIFSEALITIVFGAEYEEAIRLLKLLILGLPFLFLNDALRATCTVMNKSRYYFLSMFILTISVVVFNLILIPLFGLEGVAYSFIISWMIATIGWYMTIKDMRKYLIYYIGAFSFPIKINKNHNV